MDQTEPVAVSPGVSNDAAERALAKAEAVFGAPSWEDESEPSMALNPYAWIVFAIFVAVVAVELVKALS